VKSYFFLSIFIFFSILFLCALPALAGDLEEWESAGAQELAPSDILKNQDAVFSAGGWDEGPESARWDFESQPSSQPGANYSDRWVESVHPYPATHATTYPIADIDEQPVTHAFVQPDTHEGLQIDAQLPVHVETHNLDTYSNSPIPNPPFYDSMSMSVQSGAASSGLVGDMGAFLVPTMQVNSGASDLPFGCELCSDRFYFRGSLDWHIKQKHKPAKRKREEQPEGEETNRKPRAARPASYFCSFCDRGFVQKNSLENHIRTHTREKPFSCEICGRAFSQKCNLRRHMKDVCYMGKSSNVARCPECGYSSSRSDNFGAHMRKHEREKQEAEYWAAQFAAAAQLSTSRAPLKTVEKRQEQSNRPYGCESCPKRFNHKNNLKVHRRLHTGEKPYSCKFCFLAFRYSGALKSHERTHTGEKVYACKQCGEKFMHRNTRKNHEKKHEQDLRS
jgi:hypothetical protein